MNCSRFQIYRWSVLGLFVLTFSSALAEMREWKSLDGRKLKAEFLGTSGAGLAAQVKLKLENGSEILYPVSNLSELDRVFVKSSLPTDPAALAEEIDKLVLEKLKSSYFELKTELDKLAENKDMADADKAKRKAEIEREMAMCVPNPPTSDHQFLRRIYLDIAGRIPTYDEATRFLNTSAPNKRAALIDELLGTDAFTMRMFNYFSDLLRVREGLTMGNSDLKAIAYIEWIKKCLKDNKPYDSMVREMITAEGTIWDNPAGGFLITDQGMDLCNLSNTFTIFLGTEITCAQCHDHPFEQVKQIDFYRMATFMGKTSTKGKPKVLAMMDASKPTTTVVDSSTGKGKKKKKKNESKMTGPPSPKSEVERMSKILEEAGKLNKNRPLDRTLGDIAATRTFVVHDGEKQKVALPHDYRYDNGEPKQVVSPAAYFGDPVNLEKYKTSRQAYADWITSPGNPRFTVNIVNRLWKLAFGYGQIEPVDNIPGHLDGQAQNYELLKFLEDMFQEQNFQIKDFLRVVYNTRAYQREAETMTPSLTQVDSGTYHFPGPILRRMSAEQIWDSLVTLTTDQPDAIVREGWAEYKEFMEIDTTTLTTAEQIIAYKAKWERIGGLTKGEGQSVSKREAKIGKVQMIRASEMEQPQKPGHFLRMFGQSDKNLIEAQFTVGSTPQVMALLNGSITNEVLCDPEAYLINEVAFGEGRKGDRVEKIFLSVLGRKPSAQEARDANAMMNRKADPNASPKVQRTQMAAGIGDVVWALVNTREFMFIQ